MASLLERYLAPIIGNNHKLYVGSKKQGILGDVVENDPASVREFIFEKAIPREFQKEDPSLSVIPVPYKVEEAKGSVIFARVDCPLLAKLFGEDNVMLNGRNLLGVREDRKVARGRIKKGDVLVVYHGNGSEGKKSLIERIPAVVWSQYRKTGTFAFAEPQS